MGWQENAKGMTALETVPLSRLDTETQASPDYCIIFLKSEFDTHGVKTHSCQNHGARAP